MNSIKKATLIATGVMVKIVTGNAKHTYYSPTLPISYLSAILSELTSAKKEERENAKKLVRELVDLGSKAEQAKAADLTAATIANRWEH